MRNIIELRLVNSEKGYLKWASKSNFVTQIIFDNELVAIHKTKTTLTFNKSSSEYVY